MNQIKNGAIGAIAILLGLGMNLANATLIGDTVGGAMSTPSAIINVTNQFTPTQVVGAGTEFAGIIQHATFQNFFASIQVDVTASGFSVMGMQVTEWTAQSGGEDNLRIDLTDLDWVGMSGTIIGITDLGGAHSVFDLGYTDDSAFVIFENLDFTPTGARRIFSFNVEHASVPEPATLALFGIGLAGMGFTRRRMKE